MPYDELLESAVHVGLSEEQFWEMTPVQLRRRIAYVAEVRKHRAELEQAKQESANYRAAWICATIMNFAGKQLRQGRKVTPEELLTKKKSEDDAESARSLLVKRHRLTKRFGIYLN